MNTTTRLHPDLVVIPCTKTKADNIEAIAAADRYKSGTFTMGKRAAATIGGHVATRVLSAAHGLLRLTDKVHDYDLTIGDEAALTATVLACDLAAELNENAPRPAPDYEPDLAAAELLVIALVPNAYRELLEEAATLLSRPVVIINGFAGTHGLLDQRQRLGEIERGELRYIDLLALGA